LLCFVSARAKHVPGRKTDVSDAVAAAAPFVRLLRASWQRADTELRACVRQRERLLNTASHIQHAKH
jgi:hypothetical protein